MINVFKPVKCQEPILSSEALTRDVHLKPIHSHNDYWRQRPFLDALSYGCTSIEGDIWKFPEEYRVSDTVTETTVTFRNDEIYVGHNQVYLKPKDTVNALYLDPLFTLLEEANKDFTVPILEQIDRKFGVFFDSPESTLNMWFDLKTEGNETYQYFKQYLDRFVQNGYLTSYDKAQDKKVQGPVLITLTGDVPWAVIEAEENEPGDRHVFLDCPLHKLGDATEDELNKYKRMCGFASASLEQLLGKNQTAENIRGEITADAEKVLKQAFSTAHALGLQTRIWGGVDWPIWVRDAHWKKLWELGCDLINADDLAAAANF